LYAEIYKEFSVNPYADKALASVQGLTIDERAQRICEILSNEPNHAGSAINLLVTLRRAGAWSVNNGIHLVSAGVKIPNQIIQFWDSKEVPDDIALVMQSWKDANPGFRHEVFNDETALAFIETELSASAAKAFRMANHAAMRSELIRIPYLYVKGGVYADADDMCRHPIAPWLEEGSSLILLQEDLGSIGNNFMAAAPGNPFIRAALDQVIENILEKQGDCIWFVSGPGALTTLFCQIYLDDLRHCRLPYGIMIKDVYQMQQKISMHLPRAYKQDGRGWGSVKAAAKPIFSRC
jgi:mannosyltransferase OCH1-like enzyme